MKTRNGKTVMALLCAVFAFTQAAQAFYDANIGRWINRDPIGEAGGINLHEFSKNNPQMWVDPHGLSLICFNFGFDATASMTDGTVSKLRNSMNHLSGLLSKCCSKYGVGCAVNVRGNFDPDRKPVPDGGYAPNFRIPYISGGPGCIQLLVTTVPLNTQWQGDQIQANAVSPAAGVILNINNSTTSTLAHETGHQGGYDDGDIDDEYHHSNPRNPMAGAGGLRNDPDRCFCSRVANLAK